MNNQTMSNQLAAFYLDWVNNYLTVEKMAEHHNLTIAEAGLLIELGRAHHQEGLNNV